MKPKTSFPDAQFVADLRGTSSEPLSFEEGHRLELFIAINRTDKAPRRQRFIEWALFLIITKNKCGNYSR